MKSSTSASVPWALRGSGVRWLAASAAAAFAIACSSSSGSGLTTDQGSSGQSSGGGDDAGSSFSSGSSSSGGFQNNSPDAMGTGTCQTGVYDGTFSCYFYDQPDAGIGNVPDASIAGPITGTMSFMLTQNVTQSGELSTTDTASGTFMASTFIIAAEANLNGTLDCSQGTFTGNLVMGSFGLSGLPPDPNNMFSGPLVSDYNGGTATFVNGQWSMYIVGFGACIGTWTASYSGPGDGGTAMDAAAD